MSVDTVTLELTTSGADLPAELATRGMRHFIFLVLGLTAEYQRGSHIVWVVDDYTTPKSPLITLRGMPTSGEEAAVVERVVHGYLDVGEKLRNEQVLTGSKRVVGEATKLRGLLNGKIQALRFETPVADTTVVSKHAAQMPRVSYRSAYGAIRGRIQTLSTRGKLRFVLYDSLFDQAVSCYLDSGQEDLMRGLWDHTATVEGWVSRDPISGRPVTIRSISGIEAVEDSTPGDYVLARGALKYDPTGPLPEDRIRQIRNAGY